MYLRAKTVRKDGKTHTYWRLVKSERVGGRVRQRTVAYLGKLDAKARVEASALARCFLGKKSDQLDLFQDEPEIEPARVHVNKIRVERGRSFGDVWLAWLLWRALGLDDFCRQVFPKGREKVAWADMAAILVFARFCEPSSELHIAEDWYRRTGLEDILGVRPDRIHHRRLYEGLDHLLKRKEALEVHLKGRLGELFALDYDILLYDITSTYFEGKAAGNPIAKHGYSRDRRSDCKQVCVALVVTRDGYPLGYEVFPGNRSDVTTVEEIVEEMEKRYGKMNRVWVMDRGMTSEDNLAWLREGERKYLVATPKSELKRRLADLRDERGWEKVREGLEVKLCPGPDGEETFILCRSDDRRAKEQATHERFSKRIEEGLERLSRRLERAQRPADRSQVERQIGRLLQRNSRSAGKFQVTVKEDESKPSRLQVVWKEKPEWADWAQLTEGTYVLRSNVTDWTPEDLWRTYVQLADVEDAFRIQKSHLKIRPIWHQKEERVKAHILVCFLAYALWKCLQGWQEQAGLGSSPRTVVEELARIQSVDVIVPVQEDLRTRELRLRCVVRPDEAQKAILGRLGLELPRRLRVPDPVEM